MSQRRLKVLLVHFVGMQVATSTSASPQRSDDQISKWERSKEGGISTSNSVSSCQRSYLNTKLIDEKINCFQTRWTTALSALLVCSNLINVNQRSLIPEPELTQIIKEKRQDL